MSKSRILKVRGGIISQANRYLSGFCFSQRIFPPQIIQVLLKELGAGFCHTWGNNRLREEGGESAVGKFRLISCTSTTGERVTYGV
jgi:hypothetical protein